MNQILLTCYFFTAILLYYPMAIQSSPVDVSASLIFTLPVSILLYLWYTTIRRKEFQWKIQKKNPMTLAFGAFILISLIGVFHTVYLFGSIQSWLFLLMGFLVYLTIGNLQLKTLHEREIDVDFPMRKYRLILPSLIFLYGLIEAFWGLHQHLYGFRDQLIELQGNPMNYDPRTYAGIKYALESGRIVGSFGNPNLYAIVLAMIIPIGLMLVFQLKKNYCRLAVVLGIGLMVLSIIFSSSKGGLLAAIVGSVLFFVLSGYKQFMEKKKWLLGLIIVIILFESYALIKQQSTAQESLLTRMNIGNSSTTQERVYYWNIAAQMIKANPLVGHGLNSFGIVYAKYKPAFVGESQYAHNTFMQTFAENGFLGLIGLVVFFGTFMILPLMRWRSIKRPEVKMQLAAFYGAVAAFILDSFFGYSFYWKETPWNEIFILGCMLLGGLYAAYQAEFVPEPGPWDIVWRRQPNTPFLLISPAMVIVIVSLIYFWYYPAFRAELSFRTGKQALINGAQEMAAESFSKAVHYMPLQSNYQQYLGNTLLNLGDTTHGIQRLQKASQLNPNTGSYHADLARVYIQLQRMEDAERELKTAIECNPNQHRYLNKVHYRTELMKLYESTGRTNEALHQMELIKQIESQRN